jgi:hypothetical protein
MTNQIIEKIASILLNPIEITAHMQLSRKSRILTYSMPFTAIKPKTKYTVHMQLSRKRSQLSRKRSQLSRKRSQLSRKLSILTYSMPFSRFYVNKKEDKKHAIFKQLIK